MVNTADVMRLFGLAAAAAASTAAILWLLLATGCAWRLATDTPNHRSLHTRATPRIGGWAMAPTMGLGMLYWAITLWPLALAALLIALITQIDDRRGLSACIRLMMHSLAVIMLIWFFSPQLPGWQLLFLLFSLVWFINLYNFMDGADGLAGGMALFGFGAYAAAAAGADSDLANAAALIAGAAAGFLIFNFPPARVFLGDAGSVPLGLLAGALGYIGYLRAIWPLWFPLMIFSPFIADASTTLCRRIVRGERFWQAHREHYYQRMIQMSGQHAAPVRAWYGLMAAGAALALAGLHTRVIVQCAGAAVWLLILILLGWRVDSRWRQFTQTKTSD